MSLYTQTSMSRGEVALLRSGRIHRTIVSIAVAMSLVLAVALAKLHPGLTSTTNSGTSAGQSAGSGAATSPNSAAFGSGSTGAVSQAPIMASGGS